MAKTVEVRRGNEYLTVPEDAIDRYIAKGYDVLDASGRVVIESIPTDTPSLQAAFNKHTARIAELEAEVADLKKQLAAKPKEIIKEVVREAAPIVEAPKAEPVRTSRKAKKS